MASTLRKACHACAKSKRKCIPQLPACERCIQKGSKCTYDLQPVHHDPIGVETHPAKQVLNEDSQPLNIVYGSVESAREASIAAVANGENINSCAVRPLLLAEGVAARWVYNFFIQVAKDGIEEKRSPFIHSRIIRREISPVSTTACNSNQHEALTIVDRLVCIQHLVIQALTRLLFDRQSVKKGEDVDRIVSNLFTTTQALWQEAPKSIAELFSPWNAWLVAESIRRSMFAVVMIRGIFFMVTHGTLRYEPFFESLPFDSRSGLWEADTENVWEGLISSHGGQHTDLVSYHEFITQGKGQLDVSNDGIFQRLLFVCYHSTAGLEFLEKLDSGGA